MTITNKRPKFDYGLVSVGFLLTKMFLSLVGFRTWNIMHLDVHNLSHGIWLWITATFESRFGVFCKRTLHRSWLIHQHCAWHIIYEGLSRNSNVYGVSKRHLVSKSDRRQLSYNTLRPFVFLHWHWGHVWTVWLPQWQWNKPGWLCNIVYPSETHLKAKSREITFAHSLLIGYQIVL